MRETSAPPSFSRVAAMPAVRVLVLRQLLTWGDFAISLAPYVRRDVHRTKLQAGGTLFDRGGECQWEPRRGRAETRCQYYCDK